MFLQDGFSVYRVLVLAFFILLVILASILDLSGVVESMVKVDDIPEQSKDEKCQSAKTLIDDKKVVSVTEAVNNSAEVEVVCEDERSLGNTVNEDERSLHTVDEDERSLHTIEEEIDEEERGEKEKTVLDEGLQRDTEDDTTESTDLDTIQSADETEEEKIGDTAEEITVIEEVMVTNEAHTATDVQAPSAPVTPHVGPPEAVHHGHYHHHTPGVSRARPTVGRERHGLMSVMAEAGFRELGLDHVDGEEGEDDLPSSSRWPAPARPGLDQCVTAVEAGDPVVEAADSPDGGAVSPAPAPAPRPRQQPPALLRLLHAFSIRRNLPKLFNIRDSAEGELQCVHGIRFLSMTWVILGHTFYFAMPYLDNPVWALDKIQNSWSMEGVVQGPFSVDSFFFLSGLLVSYIFLKRRDSVTKVTSPLTWAKVILHRFIRLLPPYLALVVLLEPLGNTFKLVDQNLT